MQESKFVNNNEAAEILGVSPQTMRKIRNSEGFEFTRLGRMVLINKDFLMNFIKENRKVRY